MIKLQTKKLLLLWHLLTADNKTPGWMEEGGGDKEILKNVLIILKWAITAVLDWVCKPLSIGLSYSCAQLFNESVT